MRIASLKKQLESTIKTARIKLGEIQDAEQEKRNQKFVGRCFRYRNCYSLATKASDYWWMYFRVTGLKDGGLVIQRFQNDNRGNISIDTDEFYSQMPGGYEEITQAQYEKAFAKLLKDAGCVVG